jgi:hypothetical protein
MPQERAMPQNERADAENGWAKTEEEWASRVFSISSGR